jgi:hypothetical protein
MTCFLPVLRNSQNLQGNGLRGDPQDFEISGWLLS